MNITISTTNFRLINNLDSNIDQKINCINQFSKNKTVI